MKAIKIIKRVGACVSLVSAILICILISLIMIQYNYESGSSTSFYLSTFLGNTYSSYQFIFFVVIFAFPIIAGLIDNKISSIVISSLGIAFLIPLLINIFKATEPFTTFEYNGVTMASCVLNPSLFVDIIGLILIMLSFVVMLISSLFIKDKAK